MPNFSLKDEVFEAAAACFPTPFHLYDEAGIRDRARRLNRAFAWCPDFREYFAVKALPNPAILRILGEEGCGLDCSSATELTLAEACGFRGEEIMFSANAMPPAEYDQARALEAIINLDDASDLDILAEHGGIPECVCLRFNPGGDFAIGNTIMGLHGLFWQWWLILFVTALLASLTGLLLSIIGYSAATAFEPAVVNGIYNITCLAPAIGFVLLALALFFLYPLKKSVVEENARILAKRRSAK